MKSVFIGSFILLFTLQSFGQKEGEKSTLSPQEATAILNKFDTTKFLRDASLRACKCIDSINLANKNTDEISAQISRCIDKESVVYQGMMKIYQSLKNPSDKIIINTDKSPETQRYYYEIERWLKDSCAALNRAISSNSKVSANSISHDAKALEEYNMGIAWMKKDSFQQAAIWFRRSVNSDPRFAFAWDNLGICHRKLGNLDEAIDAYTNSLKIDPKGVMPLHNLPVAYEFQKKYDKALDAYDHLLQVYPDDPEAHYGKGRIYAFFVIDMEKALRSMCRAYNMYANASSPYRVDAEKNINYIYGKMKAEGKEQLFFDILKENKISTGN